MPLVEGRHSIEDVFGHGNETEDEPVGVRLGIHLVEVDAASTGFWLKRQRPLLDIDTGAIAVDHGGGLVERHRLNGHGRGHAQLKALRTHDGVV